MHAASHSHAFKWQMAKTKCTAPQSGKAICTLTGVLETKEDHHWSNWVGMQATHTKSHVQTTNKGGGFVVPRAISGVCTLIGSLEANHFCRHRNSSPCKSTDVWMCVCKPAPRQILTSIYSCHGTGFGPPHLYPRLVSALAGLACSPACLLPAPL